MSYQSPIEVFYNDIEYSFEDTVFKAIQKVDIKVDRNELIKALEYDRAQYDKGYSDGRFDRDSEIVRCGECKWHEKGECHSPWIKLPDFVDPIKTANFWYCYDGERRENG